MPKPTSFKKGDSRIQKGPGRPKGSLNQRTYMMDELKKGNYNPLREFIETIKGITNPVDKADKIAILFPYLYTKPNPDGEITKEEILALLDRMFPNV